MATTGGVLSRVPPPPEIAIHSGNLLGLSEPQSAKAISKIEHTAEADHGRPINCPFVFLKTEENMGDS